MNEKILAEIEVTVMQNDNILTGKLDGDSISRIAARLGQGWPVEEIGALVENYSWYYTRGDRGLDDFMTELKSLIYPSADKSRGNVTDNREEQECQCKGLRQILIDCPGCVGEVRTYKSKRQPCSTCGGSERKCNQPSQLCALLKNGTLSSCSHCEHCVPCPDCKGDAERKYIRGGTRLHPDERSQGERRVEQRRDYDGTDIKNHIEDGYLIIGFEDYPLDRRKENRRET